MERCPFTQPLPALVAVLAITFAQLGRGVSNFMDSDEAGVGRLMPEKTTVEKMPSAPNYDDYEVFPYLKQSDLEQLTEGTVATGKKYGQRYFPPDLPKFHKSDSPQNITAQLGSDIFLDCLVSELKDKMVSWRRRNNDVELLTVALEKYSKDKRIDLAFIEPNNWRLSIKSVNLGDSGSYVCEVSSDPPMELSYHIHIVVPQVKILDEHGGVLVEKYYKKGSTIELKCVVKNLPQPLGDVTWKHSHYLLNYDTSRGGISDSRQGLLRRTMSSDEARARKPVDQRLRAPQQDRLFGARSPSPMPTTPLRHGMVLSPQVSRRGTPSLLSPRSPGPFNDGAESARRQALARSADRLMPSRSLLCDAKDSGILQRFQDCTLKGGSPSEPALLEPKQAARVAQLGFGLGLEPPTRPLLKFSPPTGRLEEDWNVAMKARTGLPIVEVKPQKLLDFTGAKFCDWSPIKKNLIACLVYDGDCATFADVEEVATDKQHIIKSVSENDLFTDAKFTCDGNYAVILEVTGRVIVLNMEKLIGDAFALKTKTKTFGPCLKICTHPSSPKILAWTNLSPKTAKSSDPPALRIVDLRVDEAKLGSQQGQLGLSMQLVAEKEVIPAAARSSVVITSERAQPSIMLHESQPIAVASCGDGTIHIVDYRQPRSGPLVTFRAHSLYTSDVDFHPLNSSELISAGNDGVKIFNLSTSMKRLEYLSRHEISTFTVLQDAEELLMGFHDPVLHEGYGKKYNAQICSLRRLEPMGLMYLNPRDEGISLLRYSSFNSTLFGIQKEAADAFVPDFDETGTLAIYQGIVSETGLFSKLFSMEKMRTPVLQRQPAAAGAANDKRAKQLFGSPFSMMPR